MMPKLLAMRDLKFFILLIHSSIDSMVQRNQLSLHSKFAKTLCTCDLETTVMQLKSRIPHKSRNIKALASSLDCCFSSLF